MRQILLSIMQPRSQYVELIVIECRLVHFYFIQYWSERQKNIT